MDCLTYYIEQNFFLLFKLFLIRQKGEPIGVNRNNENNKSIFNVVEIEVKTNVLKMVFKKAEVDKSTSCETIRICQGQISEQRISPTHI